MSKLGKIDGLFEGRHFDREVIVLCVRWYPRYKLSLRDLVEMISERGSFSGAHGDHALGQAGGTRVAELSVKLVARGCARPRNVLAA